MSSIYIHKETFPDENDTADITLYHLTEKKPKFIVTIYGFLPTLQSPLKELEPHYIEIIDSSMTSFIWENARGAVNNPVENEHEVDKVMRVTPSIERLFIRTIFDPSVEFNE